MALVLADRVRDTTTTTGTGTVTLSGTAPTGYQNFSVIGNGNTTYYTINAGSQWEVGIGTYSSTGPTLARTTVLESSNANALVNFSAGTKDVFVTYPSDRAVTTDGTETLTNKTINGSNNTITNVSLTSAVTGTLPVANGGTGVTASSGANSVVLRNANQNFAVNNIDFGFTSIATAAGTTTLTVASTNTIFFTGSTTQTVVMPVTSTLVLGSAYFIRNNSTGDLTINSSGGNLIATIIPGLSIHIVCINTAVTTAAGWDFGFTDFADKTGTGNVVLSASPTFTNTVSAANITATGTVTVSGGALNSSGAATVGLTATGAITIGSTSSANAITVGQSTGSQTLNLATGATSSGNTKTVNIGTAGLSGSTTNITIGSAVSGATSTTTLNGTVSIASVIAAPLGAVGTPSYTFTGDTNTGMWSPGADTIAFSEGGVEAMRIDSDGDVGIGETSPGARLHVSGGTVGTTAGNLLNVTIDQGIAGSNAVGVRTNLVRVSSGTDWTTTAMRLQGRVDATNFGYIDFVSGGAQGLAFGSDTSERMRITSAGRVGIGTASPAQLLHVNGNALLGGSPAAQYSNVTISGDAAIQSATPLLNFVNAAGSTRFGYLYHTGSGGNIELLNQQAGAMLFGTNNTERMRIDSSGNVGIGTTGGDFGRSWRLVARQDQNAITNTGVINVNTGASAAAQISKITGTGNSFVDWGLVDNSGSPYDTFAYGSAVQYVSWFLGGSERMRLNSSGNVGIGTSAPGYKLDVNGTGYFNSSVQFFPQDGFRFTSASAVSAMRFGSAGAGESTAQWAYDRAAGATTLSVGNTGSALNERMRIDASGNVGIGTSSPSVKLDVNGSANFGAAITTGVGVSTGDAVIEVGGSRSGSGNAYMDFHAVASTDFEARVIRYGGTNGGMDIINLGTGGMVLSQEGAAPMVFKTTATERMRIASGGSVGIGTTAPTTIFHVEQNNASNIGMRMRQLSTTQFAGAGLLCNGPVSSSTQGGTAFYHYNRNTGGTNGALAMAQFDENGAFQRSLAEYYYQEQAWIFYTNGSERLRIDNSGNVGIGTSSPSYRLDIAAGDTTAGLGYAMRIRSNATATAATLQFTNSAVTTQNGIIACSDTGAMTIQTDGASSLLAFRTNGSERIRVTNGGKVGIGTSSPDATAILDVSSTTAGFLPPRMSTAERDAIGGGAPQEGLILYNVTTDKLQVYSAGAWVNLH